MVKEEWIQLCISDKYSEDDEVIAFVNEVKEEYEIGVEFAHERVAFMDRSSSRTFHRDLDEARKNGEDIPYGVGFSPDLSVGNFLGLGKYAITFILGSVTSGITWDVIKLISKKARDFIKNYLEEEHFILVFDNVYFEQSGLNIYYYIPKEISDEEFDGVIESIKKMNKRMLKLYRKCNLSSSNVKVYYDFDSKKLYLK
ncbi:hypothetical protein COT97_02315 [Candidatus Falkowbacteria bacterium CG10_big_fil_rev_8_21_14_0_10_39_11]|uniref:Uncharacterized protein n=1 Tax=Candidatus Falkowbacteria bacterium CG10_big_fil_rev_8_21_14_0_10_39_11 TaxID=1974565 RepID=A0A2H0V7H8_9BACT|nr:MAG: hypothetical protein COT97_02315 [Candidatus Falkowbacteria bacterium CG10_big_fil_rev_8_21_14_0_10_39_11]